MEIRQADRLTQLPPYIFGELDRLRNEALARGVDVINLSIGDPDRPTMEHIVKAGQTAMADPVNHPYPTYNGMFEFRKAVADWCLRRFNLRFDPDKEIISIIGSKEAVAHLPLAFVNPGEIVLCPSPGYPVYNTGTLFAGGQPYFMPLLDKNDFFPDFSAIPENIAQKAKLMFLNYPNNPTSAEATIDQFKTAVDFALKNNIIICHDAAYVDMCFDGYEAPAFMETPGAMECALELFSFSKPYQMTGWRVGMAVGNEQVISGLLNFKANIDSGVFQAIQIAGIQALKTSPEELEDNLSVYKKRRKVVIDGLKKLGLEFWTSRATFYVWSKTPVGISSGDWAARCLTEAGVVVTPGNGFGEEGEGYFRIALSAPEDRLKEAMDRISRINL